MGDENAKPPVFARPRGLPMSCGSFEDSCSRESRDSGIGLDFTPSATAPLDFSHMLSSDEFDSYPSIDEELDGLALETSMDENESPRSREERHAVEKLREITKAAASSKFAKRIQRQPMRDVTNRRMHLNDSPKGRFGVSKGGLVGGRGVGGQRSMTSLFTVSRKRSQQQSPAEAKKLREVFEEQEASSHAIPSTSRCPPSMSSASATTFYTSPGSSSSTLHRIHSCSVIERGPRHHSPRSPIHEIPPIDYHLPTVETKDSQAFRRIAPHTMTQLLRTMSGEEFNLRYFLVDCRYPFEFDGGHLKHASNVFDPSLVESLFYPSCPNQRASIQKRVPIFYCEYSQKRGPQMANTLRAVDRRRNELKYPRLDYEEIYVVDTGFRGVWEGLEQRFAIEVCEPVGYVRMVEKEFADELKKFPFHKKSSIATTCMRVPLTTSDRAALRRGSADSPSSQQSRSRRGLIFTPERKPFSSLSLTFS